MRSAIRLLHRSGVTSLTTGKIASEAGVAQPTFYVHFEDMKALLNEVASQISATIITRMQPVRETVMSEPSRRTVREACEMSVRALVEDPRFADLYLRHRRDVDTPLGKRFGELTKMARAVLREELLRIYPEGELPQLDIHVDLIFGMTLGLIEAIVDRRVSDLDAAVDILADSIIAQVRSHKRAAAAA
ncbi:MAG: TetR/AcrR family transcriptional regulator [Myxococcales bacterium]|nr:TetR/AcrR family transcriptional regulator [Myxococcales bacterium]